MTRHRSAKYHEVFWAELADYPIVAKAFKDAGFDWSKLTPSDAKTCISIHTYARAIESGHNEPCPCGCGFLLRGIVPDKSIPGKFRIIVVDELEG